MEVRNVKTTLLLATTLFLISAPAPDANDIADITSDFIILHENPGLQAAEEGPAFEHDEIATSGRSYRDTDETAGLSPPPKETEPEADSGPDSE